MYLLPEIGTNSSAQVCVHTHSVPFGVSLDMPNPMGRFCWPTGWRIGSVAGFCRPMGGAPGIIPTGVSWPGPGAMKERPLSVGPGNNPYKIQKITM